MAIADTISQRAGAYVVDWGNELEAQFKKWQIENQSAVTTLPKRPAPSGQEGGEPKKAKVTNNSGVISDEEMQKHYETDTINKVWSPNRVTQYELPRLT